MASRKSGRRKRCPWWKAEGKVVRFVDGFSIRHFNPNFDIIEAHFAIQRPGMPSIPRNQIWIDERFESEKDFLLKVLWHERRCPVSSERAMREWLCKRLTEKCGMSPTKADMKEITVRVKRKGKHIIRYVRGEKIRLWWDVWFVFGGHDLIYPDYIPDNEIWVDVRQDPV